KEMLAVLAAFFCLLFFAAAKKSRCRPAQGRRVKHEGKARMPAQKPKHRTATPEARTQHADASEKPQKTQTNPNHLRRKHRQPGASQKPETPTGNAPIKLQTAKSKKAAQLPPDGFITSA
ncbi:hypothetical protein, partial [Paraburkholderia steynii]|uniref:hypothetical protein n=1 Tax=Paraburkholderia steynii TaxID=1245441 RepID=UPI001ABEE5CA